MGRVADQQSTTNPPPPPPRPPAPRCTGEYLPSRRCCCCCGLIPSPLPVARRQHRECVPLPSPSRAHRDVRSRYVHTHSATDRDEGAALQLRAREAPSRSTAPRRRCLRPLVPCPGCNPRGAAVSPALSCWLTCHGQSSGESSTGRAAAGRCDRIKVASSGRAEGP